MMESIFFIVFLAVLTFASGYFSSSETALFSLSPIKVRTFKNSSKPSRRLIAHLLEHPRDLLVTVFMLNTLVNILLQNVASSMFGKSAGWDLKVGVPLALTLVFGEIIPKNFGLQRNVWLSELVAPTINFFQNILTPVRKLIVKITAPVSKMLFFYLQKEESISKEELRHVLETSEAHGVLNEDEAELVRGYLTIQDAQVKELMRPKEDILYYDVNTPLKKLTHLFMDQQCSRLPVCDGGLDHVIGMMTARQYFLHQPMIKTPEDIRRFAAKPFYVPENTPARMLLRRFDESRRVLALVVNEYGSIAGLITREDLVEVVIGEITDLRDQKTRFTRAGKNEIIASGKMELTDFNKIFHSDLTSLYNSMTLGGWLTEQIGDIPKAGTLYETEDFLFQVLSSDPNRVRRMYIRRKTGGGHEP